MLKLTEIAENYIDVGKSKLAMGGRKIFLLAVMAGIFVAVAGVGCTFANEFSGKFFGALVFPAGIIMVVLAGGELFTGNCLLSLPLLTGDVKIGGVLRNLITVYFGNFVGALLIAVTVVYSGVLDGISESVISVAVAKSTLGSGAALLRGIMCNVLVCLSVWCGYAAKDVGGKIGAMFFPIMIFVLAGFEHCVANMYFLPAGALMALNVGETANLTTILVGFARNMLPVTVGNLIGGAAIGAMYKFICRGSSGKKSEDK